LVLDDNRALADNIAEILRDEDLLPEVFTRAAPALEAARTQGFDLALVDVRLPDANGTDALVQLKEACPHAEVIVMSGNATLESALATVRGGAFAYLLKPISMAELLRLASLALRQVALRLEREALVAKLRDSEARYRTVVESSPTLILGLDPSGVVTLANTAAAEATGQSREALLGQPFRELVGTNGPPPAWPPESPRLELPLASPEGAERRVEWHFGASDALTFAFGVDVTETRAIERKMRAAEHLAVVGQLTAGLAHEIRNPLNSALLELKVLSRRLNRARDLDGQESVATVRSELERLERLLADFLWFARPRVASRTLGDLASPLETVARLTSAEAAEQGVTLRTELAPDLPRIVLDEDRVRQVIFNLVRNALEALAGQGSIVLRARAVPGFVEVDVEDDGPGIAEPQKVFLPFHTTKPTGTGLGLTIAQRIAADHGGELRVESRPGRTVFTLSLPTP